MVLSTYLTALVMIAAYSGALISFIAVEQPRLPFKSLAELVRDGSYRILVSRDTASYRYFEVGFDGGACKFTLHLSVCYLLFKITYDQARSLSVWTIEMRRDPKFQSQRHRIWAECTRKMLLKTFEPPSPMAKS